MATTLDVSIDLGSLIQVGALARENIFSNLSEAVARVARTGEERWKRAVQAAPGIWSGEAMAYAATIRAEQTGPLAWMISSDYKYVEDIETGRPPYDLKRMLDTSMKVRVSKTGRRYLIIPFRHNTPGHDAHARAMPQAIYNQAKEMSASRVTGRTSRRSGTGAYDIRSHRPVRVAARKYLWGDRLPKGLAPKLKPEHKSDPYAGMVRFDTTTPRGKKSSAYMTFRVMAEGSPGWVIPARPGLWIAKNVADSLQRTAEKDFAEAIQRDLD